MSEIVLIHPAVIDNEEIFLIGDVPFRFLSVAQAWCYDNGFLPRLGDRVVWRG